VARSWGRQIYRVERVLRMRQWLPLIDYTQASQTLDFIQDLPYWKKEVSRKKLHISVVPPSSYAIKSGMRHHRRTRSFVLTLSMGECSVGRIIHEAPHAALYFERPEHGDKYLRCWLNLWQIMSHADEYRPVFAYLRRLGVPVDEFLS